MGANEMIIVSESKNWDDLQCPINDAVGSIYKMYLWFTFFMAFISSSGHNFIKQFLWKLWKGICLCFPIINFLKVVAYTSLSFMKESTVDIKMFPLQYVVVNSKGLCTHILKTCSLSYLSISNFAYTHWF